jgi:soluble lytic murein transglycosylase-like protein
MSLILDAIRRYGEGAAALDAAIQRFSADFRVEVNLSRAVAFAESSFNPGTPRGKRGEIGPFQIIPTTAEYVRNLPNAPDAVRMADVYSIEGNAAIGIFYLSTLLHQFQDKWKAVAAYNAGPTRVANLIKRYGEGYFQNLPQTTQAYVQRVQRIYAQLVAESAPSPLPDLPRGILDPIRRFVTDLSRALNVPVWVIALFVAALIAIALIASK